MRNKQKFEYRIIIVKDNKIRHVFGVWFSYFDAEKEAKKYVGATNTSFDYSPSNYHIVRTKKGSNLKVDGLVKMNFQLDF